MITNVHRANASGDIQRYIRYTIAPDKDQKSEHYKHGERTLSIEGTNLFVGVGVERNKTSHDITNQILKWNEDKRAGRSQPKSPALLGVVSFTENDTNQFYSTSKRGVEFLDLQKVMTVGKEMIGETMGYDRPMFLSAHGDKHCLHIHFATSLVNSKGQIWDGSILTDEHGNKKKVRDFRQWEITNEKLEVKYGLDRVEHRKAFEHQGEHRQSQVARPSNASIHLAEKGILSPSLELSERLELAYNGCNKQFDKFLELAEQNGVHIKPNMNDTKVNGLSFSTDNMDNFIKASDLGNKYKWAKLSKELNYDSSRDHQKLADLKNTGTNNQRPAIKATVEIERLARITEELAETIRHEQGVNVSDNGISPSLGHEDRNELARPSSVPQEVTGQRASNREDGRSENTRTTSTDNRHIAASLDSVGGSPSYQPSSSIRYVESVKQSIQSATDDNSGNGFNEQTVGQTGTGRSNEQPVATVDLQEDKVKRRERSITNLMTKGGMTREQAENAYNDEQKLAEKRALEKENASVWTPDKQTNKSDMTKALEAYAKQVNTPNRTQTRSTEYSSDSGLSI